MLHTCEEVRQFGRRVTAGECRPESHGGRERGAGYPPGARPPRQWGHDPRPVHANLPGLQTGQAPLPADGPGLSSSRAWTAFSPMRLERGCSLTYDPVQEAVLDFRSKLSCAWEVSGTSLCLGLDPIIE